MNDQPDKMTKELHLKLVEAWWDGELETHYNSGWDKSICGPTEHSSPNLFRIRPKPRLRPWKPEEVPVGALIRLRNRETINSWLIVGFSADTGRIAFGTSGDREIGDLADIEHSTDGGRSWKPCGVEESQ